MNLFNNRPFVHSFLLFFLIFQFTHVNAQSVCNDTFFTKKLSKVNWDYLDLNPLGAGVIGNNNMVASLLPQNLSTGGERVSLMMNDKGEILKSQKEKGSSGIIGKHFVKESKFSGFYTDGGPFNARRGATSFTASLNKLDKEGNLIWKKIYTVPYLRHLAEEENGNLFLLSDNTDEGFYLTKLDSAGTPIWSFAFNYPVIKENTSTKTLNIQVIGSSVYVFGVNLKTIYYAWLKEQPQIFAMRINTATGELEQAKALVFPTPFKSVSHSIHTFTSNGQILISATGMTDSCSSIIFIKMDQNLEVIKSIQFTGPKDARNVNYAIHNINENGITYADFSYNLPPGSTPDNKVVFFVKINADMSIQFQRRIAFDSRMVPASFFTNHKNENFFFATQDFVEENSKRGLVSLTVMKLPDYVVDEAGCFGKDTAIFQGYEPLKLDERTIKLVRSAPINNLMENDYVTIEDYPIDETYLCKVENICDSIFITGEHVICDTGSVHYFKASVNDQCLKKVEWEVEPQPGLQIENEGQNQIKLILTAYNKNVRLKASIPSCAIADSVTVQIRQPDNPVHINGDTVICHDEITLKAPEGYAYYRWSNGSSSDKINISDEGVYWVSAIDSCGMLSSDTISVARADVSFSVSGNQLMCRYDSTTLVATGGFKNYQLFPESAAYGGIFPIITVSPYETTKYTITAERFPGCNVSSDIIISVSNCPQNISFPNSFTPNGDGLNDLFIPIVEGNPEYYQFRVFNRYGQVVFQSADAKKGWDGNFRHEIQPIGIYSWVCEYKFPGREKLLLKGTVRLIR